MDHRQQLTDRQRDFIEFIRAFKRSHGYSPTIREIGVGLGIRSPNGVMCHVHALKKKGYLTCSRYNARTIAIVDDAERTKMMRKIKVICELDGHGIVTVELQFKDDCVLQYTENGGSLPTIIVSNDTDCVMDQRTELHGFAVPGMGIEYTKEIRSNE